MTSESRYHEAFRLIELHRAIERAVTQADSALRRGNAFTCAAAVGELAAAAREGIISESWREAVDLRQVDELLRAQADEVYVDATLRGSTDDR